VDFFHGHLQGLVIAEVELDSEDEEVPTPPWLGDEITSSHQYANSCLAMWDTRLGDAHCSAGPTSSIAPG
jgi:CYTH domain-containing protein